MINPFTVSGIQHILLGLLLFLDISSFGLLMFVPIDFHCNHNIIDLNQHWYQHQPVRKETSELPWHCCGQSAGMFRFGNVRCRKSLLKKYILKRLFKERVLSYCHWCKITPSAELKAFYEILFFKIKHMLSERNHHNATNYHLLILTRFFLKAWLSDVCSFLQSCICFDSESLQS